MVYVCDQVLYEVHSHTHTHRDTSSFMNACCTQFSRLTQRDCRQRARASENVQCSNSSRVLVQFAKHYSIQVMRIKRAQQSFANGSANAGGAHALPSQSSKRIKAHNNFVWDLCRKTICCHTCQRERKLVSVAAVCRPPTPTQKACMYTCAHTPHIQLYTLSALQTRRSPALVTLILFWLSLPQPR